MLKLEYISMVEHLPAVQETVIISSTHYMVVCMRCSTWHQVSEYLLQSWWCCLGRSRRCGPAGGNVSLEAGFEVSKPHNICSLLSLIPAGVQDVSPRLSAHGTMPFLCHHGQLWIISPKKAFLLQLALVLMFYLSKQKVTNTQRQGKQKQETFLRLVSWEELTRRRWQPSV